MNPHDPDPGSAGPPLAVTFFLDEPTDRLLHLDPDAEWRGLQRGEHAWILQTYLRLARAGHSVALSNQLPSSGIVVFHAKQRAAIQRAGNPPPQLLLLETLGDIRPARNTAHAAVVQNAHSADGERRFFVPHWPQPGLLPRDEGRDTTVQRVAYKGFDLNLDSYFRTAEWRGFLASHRMEWMVDSVPYAGAATAGDRLDWPDFRSIDVILALRPSRASRQELKPATKLYNSWLAGVPAVLGPEVGFREIRQSPLDYLEIRSPGEARDAVLALQRDAELYRRMVEHGRRRSAEFTVAATTARWMELLRVTIPRHAAALLAPRKAALRIWFDRARRRG